MTGALVRYTRPASWALASCDAAHIAGTKFLGQLSSTPVGFVTAKGSRLAPVLQGAVNKLIASGAYRKIVAKWGVTGSAITTSQVNPKPSF